MKKYIKYIIASIVLVFVIVFLLLFFNIPRINYTLDTSKNEYYVSGVYGNSKSYKIEKEINGIKVTKIGVRAFYNKSNLEEIVLPDNVNYISRLAFSECKNLKNINLDKINVIERNAFSYDTNLDNITISAINIGASSFYKCSSLCNLSLNDGIITIGDMAFAGTKITKVSIPRSVKELGNNVFYECYALANINVYGANLLGNDYLKSLNIVNYIG